MSLVIQIQENANLEFFTQFDLLTHLQKKIFSALQWWVRKFPSAFPKQERIAEHLGCSRKHVNKTMKKFQEYGWIFLTSRGKNRTKIIGMCIHLVMMEIYKREYLRNLKVTSEVTHTSYRIKKYTGKEKTDDFASALKVSDHVQKLGISLKNKLKLSLVPENCYYTALEIAKSKHAKDEKSFKSTIENFVVGTAIKLAEKLGKKIDWKSYYQALKGKI